MALYYITSNKYSLQGRTIKNGKRVFDVHFRIVTIDGQEKQKRLCGFETKSLAKAGYMHFVAENCEMTTRSVKKKKDPEKEILIVGDLIRQYLSTLGNQNKQSGIYDKNNIYRLYVLSKYDKTPITALTKEELYQWQDWLWSQKNLRTNAYFSQQYLLKIRGRLNVFLSWVEQRYNIRNNLVDVIKPKKRVIKKEMSFWTKEQFQRFISGVDNPTYHALFTFMFYTGRRKGELFALYKTDVKPDKITYSKSFNRRHFGQGTWEITITKADKTCTLPVCNAVRQEIKNYKPPKEGKFYFGGKEPLAPTTVERYFKRYTQKANLPEIRIHDLRHSFASMVIHEGGNLLTVATLLSDTVEMVTKTYAHLYLSDLTDILAKI
jgi:integrase